VLLRDRERGGALFEKGELSGLFGEGEKKVNSWGTKTRCFLRLKEELEGRTDYAERRAHESKQYKMDLSEKEGGNHRSGEGGGGGKDSAIRKGETL